MSLEIIKEKVAQAVDILNEKNIDMWVTFVQETKVLKDPIMDMTVGDHSTWKSAFIINKDGDTTAIVGDMELENFVKSGVYKNIIGYLKSFKEPFVEYVKKKNPQIIAINYSVNSVLSDGLTHGMYLLLMDYLKGTGYENKIVSAEEIISPLRGRKSDKELAIMQEAVDETLKIFDMVTEHIKPGLSEKDIADYVLKVTRKRFWFSLG
jgi:Xaa-Pro aminopeptidase